MAQEPKVQEVNKRPNRLITHIIKKQNARSKKDIRQWRVALQAAENVDNPNRTLLYNVYNEILLDAHLTAEIKRRSNALLGSGWELYNDDGNVVPEASILLRKKWFRKLIEYAWQSILWGHSLMEIEALTEDGNIHSIRLINRYNVIPEKGIVVENQGDTKGINFREDTRYKHWLFEFGDDYGLGLLNKCVPNVIFKRFAQSAYSEYTEVLAIPPRVLQTDAYDTEHLNRSVDMMENMGSSSYAVIGKNEEIKFVDTPSSDGSIFVNLFKISSAEISKLIGGAVIGENSDSGSRAKEQVSLELSQQTKDSDKLLIEEFINEHILPRLASMGYPVDGLHFEYVQEKNIMQELDIALRIAQQFELSDEGIEYINQNFGISVLKQKEQPSFGGFGDFDDDVDAQAIFKSLKKKDFLK